MNTEIVAKICTIAVEAGKRAAETGARPEDWLNERFVSRIVSQHVADVLIGWMLGDLKLPVVVHAKEPACGFTKEGWPDGHKGSENSNDVTCPICLLGQYRALGLLPKMRGRQ